MGWRPKAKPKQASTFREYYEQELAGTRSLALTTQTSLDRECSYCGSCYPVEVRPTCSQCGAPRPAPASYRDEVLYGEGGFPVAVRDSYFSLGYGRLHPNSDFMVDKVRA